MSTFEDRVRTRAYFLWKAAGEPTLGNSADDWQRAMEIQHRLEHTLLPNVQDREFAAAPDDVKTIIQKVWDAVCALPSKQRGKLSGRCIGALDTRMTDGTRVIFVTCSSPGVQDLTNPTAEAAFNAVWTGLKNIVESQSLHTWLEPAGTICFAQLRSSIQQYAGIPKNSDLPPPLVALPATSTSHSDDRKLDYHNTIVERMICRIIYLDGAAETRECLRNLLQQATSIFQFRIHADNLQATPETLETVIDFHWENLLYFRNAKALGFDAKIALRTFLINKLPQPLFLGHNLSLHTSAIMSQPDFRAILSAFPPHDSATLSARIRTVLDQRVSFINAGELRGGELFKQAATDAGLEPFDKNLEARGPGGVHNQTPILQLLACFCIPTDLSRLADYFAQCAEDNASLEVHQYLKDPVHAAQHVASATWYSTELSGTVAQHKPLCPVCFMRFIPRLKALLYQLG
eukprot:m.253027 g.253027  ORF g.253027 m.253027 type:complete len:461 (+) comp18117_c0_seq1:61-1443(+)